MEYCVHTAGRFIHHVPSGPPTPASSDDTLARYEQLLNDYELVFGDQPPRNVWPKLSRKDGSKLTSGDCETCKPYYPPCDPG
jgi:hypothetical protein